MTAHRDSTHWSNQKERTTVWGMKFLFTLYRLFGRHFLLIFLAPVVLFYWLQEKTFQKNSLSYLQKAHRAGLLEKAPSRIDTLRHLMFFAETILDKMISLSGDTDHFSLRIENDEALRALITAKRGAVVLTSHMGCIEALQAYGNRFEEINIVALVHQKNSSDLNNLLKKLNPLTRFRFIEVTELTPAVAMELEEEIARGTLIFVAGDRSPIQSKATVEVDFLGDAAAFPIGGVVLANLFHAPLFQMTCTRLPRSEAPERYRVRFHTLSDGLTLPRKNRTEAICAVVNDYAQELEANCRLSPYDWSNFYDFWKAHD